MKKRLCKSSREKKLCGVCAGIANYFNIDAVFIRVLWVFTFFAFGISILFYFVCAFIMPYDSELDDSSADYEYAPKD